MTPDEILTELEARRVELQVAGDRLRIRPVSRVPEYLLEELRSHKAEVVEMVSLRGWPEASRQWVVRLRRPEVRLYPFVGEPVVSPLGHGRLLGVLPDRAEVQVAGRVFVFLPSEVRPPGVTCYNEDNFEPVH
ncbi:MAG TPA: hypothetical protein VLF66_08930 [Thermoanaerobaculia bacterium]|nr:hypothetical protein [Thermoanaerobaculia bacterium]